MIKKVNYKNNLRIVFLGSRPISLKIYNLIKKNIVAVIKVKEKKKFKWWNKDVNSLKINFNTLKNLQKINFDLGFSINYNKIIPQNILRLAKIGFINIHYSYKNYYKGRNIMFFSIMNYPKQKAGFTIHWMNKKIDDGNIIAYKKVKIKKNDTSEKLYFRIEKELLSFLKKNFFKNLKYYLSLKGFKNNKSIYYKKNDIDSKIKEKLNNKFNKKKLMKALTFKKFNKKYL